MTRPGSDEAPTVASGQHAPQSLQSIDGDRQAFDGLRAAAACKGIAVYELANGEVLVCKWGLSRAVPVDALAAFLAPMGVWA